MRYHYSKPDLYLTLYGKKYECNHYLYSECTLFLIGDKGLAVIQQRFNPETKQSWWGPIDDYLNNDIYTHIKFRQVFEKYARTKSDGLYPTLTIRQLMYCLRMKPLTREAWETYFDRKPL